MAKKGSVSRVTGEWAKHLKKPGKRAAAKAERRSVDLNQLKGLAGGGFTSFGNMLKKIAGNDKGAVREGGVVRLSAEASAELIRVLNGE